MLSANKTSENKNDATNYIKHIKNLDLISTENKHDEIFILESGRVLIQTYPPTPISASCAIYTPFEVTNTFTIWDPSLDDTPQFILKLENTTPKQLFECYLPEGPLMSAISDRILFKYSEEEFLYRSATKLDGFYDNYRYIINHPEHFFKIEGNKYIIPEFKDGPLKSAKVVEKNDDQLIIKKTFEFKYYNDFKNSKDLNPKICMPSSSILVVTRNHGFVDIWERDSNDDFTLAKQFDVKPALGKYELLQPCVLSDTEIIAIAKGPPYTSYLHSFADFPKNYHFHPDLIVKIDFKNQFIYKTHHFDMLSWELWQYSDMPLFFVAAKHSVNKSNVLMFDPYNMSVNSCGIGPLNSLGSIKSMPGGGMLTHYTESCRVPPIADEIQIYETPLKKYIDDEILPILAQFLINNLVQIVAEYCNADCKLSNANLFTFIHAKNPTKCPAKPDRLIDKLDETSSIYWSF